MYSHWPAAGYVLAASLLHSTCTLSFSFSPINTETNNSVKCHSHENTNNIAVMNEPESEKTTLQSSLGVVCANWVSR